MQAPLQSLFYKTDEKEIYICKGTTLNTISYCMHFGCVVFWFCFLKQSLAVHSQTVPKLIFLQFSILLFMAVVVWIIFTNFWHLGQRAEEADTNGKATKDCIQKQSERGDKRQESQVPQQDCSRASGDLS